MTKQLVDATPPPDLMRSISAQNLDWRRVLGELIDNAFDAGAVTVAMTMGKTFRVTDNGTGCSELSVFVTPGGRVSHSTTTMGTYGVGAKDATLWIGNGDPLVVVKSVHRGVERSMRWDWREFYAGGSWRMSADVSEGPAEPDARGTSIVVMPRGEPRRTLHGEEWTRLVADIGYMYSAALQSGRQISLSRDGGRAVAVATPYALPEFEPGSLDERLEVDGRTAHIRFGIVKRGVFNPRAGITYTSGFRVVVKNGDAGCGPYGCTRVAGVVTLGPGWKLTKNKDGILKADALYAAVFARCEALLKRAETESHTLELRELETTAQAMVNDLFTRRAPDTKARRGKGEERGTKAPTGEGGKHNRARNTQDGETFRRIAPDGFKIKFDDGEGPKAGTFIGAHTVVLYKNHPFVAAAIAQKNNLAIVGHAVDLIADHIVVMSQQGRGGQLALRGVVLRDGEQFADLAGRILQRIRFDGETVTDSTPASLRIVKNSAA